MRPRKKEKEPFDFSEYLFRKIQRIEDEGRTATIADLAKLAREPQGIVLTALRRHPRIRVLTVGRLGEFEAVIRQQEVEE